MTLSRGKSPSGRGLFTHLPPQIRHRMCDTPDNRERVVTVHDFRLFTLFATYLRWTSMAKSRSALEVFEGASVGANAVAVPDRGREKSEFSQSSQRSLLRWERTRRFFFFSRKEIWRPRTFVQGHTPSRPERSTAETRVAMETQRRLRLGYQMAAQITIRRRTKVSPPCPQGACRSDRNSVSKKTSRTVQRTIGLCRLCADSEAMKNLVQKWPKNALQMQSDKAIVFGRYRVLAATFDRGPVSLRNAFQENRLLKLTPFSMNETFKEIGT